MEWIQQPAKFYTINNEVVGFECDRTSSYITALCNNVRVAYMCDVRGQWIVKCPTWFTKRLLYPECIECLCQSAELLEGKLHDKS